MFWSALSRPKRVKWAHVCKQWQVAKLRRKWPVMRILPLEDDGVLNFLVMCPTGDETVLRHRLQKALGVKVDVTNAENLSHGYRAHFLQMSVSIEDAPFHSREFLRNDGTDCFGVTIL